MQGQHPETFWQVRIASLGGRSAVASGPPDHHVVEQDGVQAAGERLARARLPVETRGTVQGSGPVGLEFSSRYGWVAQA